MITNDLKIAKTNDVKGAYRLIERIENGNITEAAQAYVEAALLGAEASSRFFEVIDRKSYWNYLPIYLEIALNKAKVQDYFDLRVIWGDRLNQMLIGSAIASTPEDVLKEKFRIGALKPRMEFFEVQEVLDTAYYPSRRQTKKIKKEHQQGIYEAYVEHLYAK